MPDTSTSNKFIVSVEERLQLLLWFLVIVTATMVFKFGYIDTIFRGGFSVAIGSYLESDTKSEYFKVVGLLFVRNIAEVGIILLLLYIVFCKLLRVKLAAVIVISTLTLFFVAGANQLSLLNVKSLLTFDSLMVSIHWMKDNPDVISSYISKRNLLYFVLIIFLSFLPLLLTKVLMTKSSINRLLTRLSKYKLNHVFSSTALAIFSASIILYFSTGVFLQANANLKPFNGYWSLVTTSLIGADYPSPLERKIPGLAEMKSQYFNLVYPDTNGKPIQNSPYSLPANTDKKHIIIISLETAPEKYYPLVNNPKFKSFYQMSKHSIVTNKHFTNSPYTLHATDSMLTGTYMPSRGMPILYGGMAFNGLANVLTENGYLPTFIDSYLIDWHVGDIRHRAVNSYGFKRTFDRSDYNFKKESSKLTGKFAREKFAEKASFNHIVDSIDDAISRNKKSLVFVDTIMGHFKWSASKENKSLSSEDKILKIAEVFDNLLAGLLSAIAERNIEDDVIIVITGDHGLRYNAEYASLSEEESNLVVGFNVPLLIYSPGLFKEQVTLDHVTSHVDLTPTLLELVGIDISNYFFHGQNILDPTLESRTIFLMNQNLKPENSFLKQDVFYTYNDYSSETYISSFHENNEASDHATPAKITATDSRLQTIRTLSEAKKLFDDAAAYFLKRHKTSAERTLDSQDTSLQP